MSQTEVQLIKDAVIVNADVSNSAAIDVSKISGALPAAGGTITGDVTFDGATAGRDIVFDRSDDALEFADNAKAKFGNGDDLSIFHNGSHSVIAETGTGNLQLRCADFRVTNADNSETIIVGNTDGAVELYHNNSKKFETNSTGAFCTGELGCDTLYMGDNDKVKVGSNDDLQIFHNGTDSLIKNDTNTLRILADSFQVDNNANSEVLINAVANGAVELYHDNTKRFETTANGVEVSAGRLDVGSVTLSGGGLALADDDKLICGSGDDLQIFHNGNHSFIEDSGTGNLFVKTSKLAVENAAGNESLLAATQDGSVELFHNGSKKFETTSDGVSVTGTLTTDKATFTDDGSGEPIVHIRTDDANPWAFVINNDNSSSDTTSGLKWYVQNDGDGIHQIRGSSAFKNFFITTSNSSTSENALAINTSRGVDLYYQNVKKLETVSGGVNIIGALTVNGGSVGGGKVIQVLSANSNSSSTSSGTFQATGLSKSITMTDSANKILVIASGTMNNSGAGSGGGITIKRGTTNLAHSNDVMASFFGEDNSNNLDNGVTIHALDGPGAGTHTYEVYLRAFSGTQRFAYRDTGVITLLELDFS